MMEKACRSIAAQAEYIHHYEDSLAIIFRSFPHVYSRARPCRGFHALKALLPSSPGLSMHPKAAQPRGVAMEMNGSKPREGQVKTYY